MTDPEKAFKFKVGFSKIGVTPPPAKIKGDITLDFDVDCSPVWSRGAARSCTTRAEDAVMNYIHCSYDRILSIPAFVIGREVTHPNLRPEDKEPLQKYLEERGLRKV